MSKKFTLGGTGIEVEVGKYAGLADGAAWVKCGGNIVLSCVTAAHESREFMGFFPLTVEYREKTAAAGRIPGGYIKREGRLSDTEVLNSRVIDRSIRPFFPDHYFNEVQLLSTVYSSDGKAPSNVLALLGASIAINVSSIPFEGPIGAVQVHRINGQWVFNGGLEEEAASDVNVMVAGTKTGICMVEGSCNALSEEEMVALLFAAHAEIYKQVVWQEEIIQEIGKHKIDSEDATMWRTWSEKVTQWFNQHDMSDGFFKPTKVEQSAGLRESKRVFQEAFSADISSGAVHASVLSYLFEKELKDRLPDAIVNRNHRFDSRSFDEVRPITVEVGILPQVHGSGTFRRGQTLALASVTLGTAQDAQKVEHLVEGVKERSFMLHYNFPPYAVGEVKPIRSVGRREIGHGYLAERSFNSVIPSQEAFPYTIRSVVDILECHGSSSMATVCATTMALMDAGVPITEMVAGVAMGLLHDSSGKYHVLTDILGSEDALGLMDFKVTGSDRGIYAIQMDIKAKDGLSESLMAEALRRARTARIHILGEMRKVMSEHRPQISSLAPKVTSFRIPVDTIGIVIGPSGKMIKEIIAATDTQIDIEDDGTVKVYSRDQAAGKMAEQWIRVLAGDITEGAVFNGIIRRFVEFGLFVELVPGKDGLIHVSNISKDKQRTLTNQYKVGDTLQVKVISHDRESGRVKLVAPDLA